MNIESKPKILAVDDVEANLTTLKAILSTLDAEVMTADCGEAAIALCRYHQFALLLIDVHMPGMNGFETTSKINEINQDAYLPIIFITGNHQEDRHISHGYREGAVDYIFKPVNPFVLKSKASIFLDIFRYRTQLEDTLEALHSTQNALKKSNRDLREFSHVVAHDLKAPLRHVQAYCDLLSLEMQNKEMSDEANQYLETIRSSSQKMHQLIHDVLSYAEADRIKPEFSKVDLQVTLAHVLDVFKTHIQEKHAKINLPVPLPSIEANEVHMQQLLQNLIDNALKYAKDDVPPSISIQYKKDDACNQLELVVSDNGIGFSEEENELVFSPFKRLVPQAHSEGSGVGLALLQKIVHAHDGTIKAEGNPNQGATFTIRLPVWHPE